MFMCLFNPVPKPKRKKSKKNIEKSRKSSCEYCGRYGKVHVHHIVSVGAGGNDEPGNLISLCVRCHTKTHNGEIKKAELQAIRGD